MRNTFLTVIARLRKSLSDNRGFTMVELMIVVTIIAILTGISITVYRNYIQRAKVTAAKAQIEQLKTSILTMGTPPSSEEGLNKIVEEGLIKKQGLNDPWGRPYQYRAPGEHEEFDIWSFGADGKEGGEGFNADITSWETK